MIETEHNATGDGFVSPKRKQRYVRVRGTYDMEKFPKPGQPSKMCMCLLAPETPYATGKTRFCREDCAVSIKQRNYMNCTELGVWNELIDLEGLGVPKVILLPLIEKNRIILVTEGQGLQNLC